MKQALRWHAAHLRQFRHTAKKLNRLHERGIQAHKLERKLREQWLRLRRVFQTRQLLQFVSGAALVLLVGSAQAQVSFSGPVTNPFGFTQTGTQEYQFLGVGDLDGDGDYDLIMTDYYAIARRYYENTGTVSMPDFAAPVLNPNGMAPGGTLTPYTSYLVDMDNDGDLDLFGALEDLGTYAVSLHYQENQGTAMAASFGRPVASPFGIKQNPYAFFPAAADIDNDGDLDLFAGSGDDGVIYFYENEGTATMPVLGQEQKNPFGLTGAPYYTAAPVLFDMDNDGDLDMLISDEDAVFFYFENTGTAGAPAFGPRQMNPFGLQGPSGEGEGTGLAAADMDNDGDMDLLMSDYGGVLYYFENTTPNTSSIDGLAHSLGLAVSPNPASGFVEVNMESPAPVSCVLTDIQGKAMSKTSFSSASNRLDLSQLKPGLYFVSISDGVRSYSEKLVVR